MFFKKKKKCYYCGDKHRRTKKYKCNVRTNSGSYDIWCCNTCGKLRGIL